MGNERLLRYGALTALLCVATPVSALEGPTPGALTASKLTLPSGPASVRGLTDDPSVTAFSAEVRYSVPIELPKAAGGLAPAFSLAYDGARGNGVIGLGWSLDFPRIRRSQRLGIPSYTQEDELELVGLGVAGRLRTLADGSLRVEGAGQTLRVTKTANTYIVTDSNGVKYYMGLSEAGRQVSQNKTAQWLTQNIVHPNGQSVALEYTKDQNEVYLSKLKWGAGNGLVATLNYDTRPDVVTSYRAGFKVTTQKRLSTVVVDAYQRKLRTYHLQYDDQYPLSRLASVTMTGSGSESLPPVTFSYHSSDDAGVEVLAGGDGYTPALQDVALVDVDGDGLADLTRLASNDHRYWRNVGGGFADESPLPGAEGASLSGGTAQLMDMDGDGRTELVRGGARWEVLRLREGGWQDAQMWAGTEQLPVVNDAVSFADLNGDGRTDMLQRAGAGMLLRMNRSGSLAEPVFVPSFDGAPLPDARQLRFQDANGDELADAIRIADSHVTVFPGMGDGRFDAPYEITLPFVEPDPNNIWLADLNRDGILDVVHVEQADVVLYATSPDGSIASESALARPAGLEGDVRIDVADVNGNGSIDVVWSTPLGMWCLDLAGAARGGMLEKVDNGLGKVISFSYRASAELALEDELRGLPWSDFLQVSIPVPTEARTTQQSGEADQVTSYAVRDGFYDYQERRFGGFRIATVTELGDTPEATRVDKSFFLTGEGNDRVLRGKEHRRETRDGNGKLLSVNIQQWASKLLDGFPAGDPLLRYPALLNEWVQTHEGSDTPLTTRTLHRYDGQGNQIGSDGMGRLDLTGDELYTQRTYAGNDTTWVRGVLVEETKTDAAGVVHAKSRTLYDGTTTPLPSGQVTKGWARRTESWLASESRWIVTQETDYDAYGNPVALRNPDGSVLLTYDVNGLYPYRELHRGTSGTQSMEWTSEWDVSLGQPLSVTGPDGVTVRVTYDSLARPIQQTVDGTVTQHYAYDWSAPRPTTTTQLFEGDLDGNGVVDGNDTRTIVTVSNSAGKPLYAANRMGDTRWLLLDGKRYGRRGEVTFDADAMEWNGTNLPNQLPPTATGQSSTFDALGRVLAQRLPTGDERRYSYGRFETSTSSPEVASILHKTDGHGRVIEASRTVGGTLERATTVYNPVGRVLSFSLQGGAVVHRFTHDTLGRLLTSNDPDSGTRSYAYDDGGRITVATNAAGQTVRYTYDSFGRVATVSGDEMRKMTVHYDVPRVGSAMLDRTAGRAAWIEEGSAGDRVEFAYDRFGRVEKLTRVVAGETVVENTTWTPAGSVLRRSFDDGFEYDFSYDRAGRVTAVGDLWRSERQDAAGRILEETYGNSVRQTYQRNALGFVERARVLGSAGPATPRHGTSGVAMLDLHATYNHAGALKTISDLDGLGENHAASFEYDDAARLTKAKLFELDVSYSYDALQNMKSRTISRATTPAGMQSGNYVYGESGAGPRQLTSVGARKFSYDAAGRMVKDGTSRMLYDAMDRMFAMAHETGDAAEHRYGYDGVRTLSQSEDHQERVFTPHVSIRDGVREHYVRVGQRVLARVDFTRRNGTWTEVERLYHHPAFGEDAVLLTGAAGDLRDERRYEPFGTRLAGDQTIDAMGSAGKTLDPISGWADHGARWYGSQFGRWTAPDPVVQDPSSRFATAPWDLNPYQFVRQNPNVYSDPDGRDPWPKYQCTVNDSNELPGLTRIREQSQKSFPNLARTNPGAHAAAIRAKERFERVKWYGPTWVSMANVATKSASTVIDGKIALTSIEGARKDFVVLFGKKVVDSITGAAQDMAISGVAGEAFAKKLGVVLAVVDVVKALNGERVANEWKHMRQGQRDAYTYKLVRNAVAEKGTSPAFEHCSSCRTIGERQLFLAEMDKQYVEARTELAKYEAMERNQTKEGPPSLHP